MMWRRQCPTWARLDIGLQCQRLTKHDGPHKASLSDHSTTHHSWTDSADPFSYKTLPGTVRYRPAGTPSRAYLAGEWALDLALAALLWFTASATSALVFLVLTRLLSVRRPHFVDVGRFTADLFLVSRRNYPPFFAIGFARYGPEPDAGRSGLQVIVGRVSLMVCALLPRDEWTDSSSRKPSGRPDGRTAPNEPPDHVEGPRTTAAWPVPRPVAAVGRSHPPRAEPRCQPHRGHGHTPRPSPRPDPGTGRSGARADLGGRSVRRASVQVSAGAPRPP